MVYNIINTLFNNERHRAKFELLYRDNIIAATRFWIIRMTPY